MKQRGEAIRSSCRAAPGVRAHCRPSRASRSADVRVKLGDEGGNLSHATVVAGQDIAGITRLIGRADDSSKAVADDEVAKHGAAAVLRVDAIAVRGDNVVLDQALFKATYADGGAICDRAVADLTFPWKRQVVPEAAEHAHVLDHRTSRRHTDGVA